MQQTYLAGRSALFDLHTKSHIHFQFDLAGIDVGRLSAASYVATTATDGHPCKRATADPDENTGDHDYLQRGS